MTAGECDEVLVGLFCGAKPLAQMRDRPLFEGDHRRHGRLDTPKTVNFLWQVRNLCGRYPIHVARSVRGDVLEIAEFQAAVRQARSVRTVAATPSAKKCQPSRTEPTKISA